MVSLLPPELEADVCRAGWNRLATWGISQHGNSSRILNSYWLLLFFFFFFFFLKLLQGGLGVTGFVSLDSELYSRRERVLTIHRMAWLTWLKVFKNRARTVFKRCYWQYNTEIPKPSTEGPKIMIGAVVIGTVTGTIFLIVLLFVCGDINQVIDSATGPLVQILKNATSNNAGAICLLMWDDAYQFRQCC